MPFHPLANLLPAMSPDEFAVLVNDIAVNKQLRPILTFKGAIVDGRHRYSACCSLGITPIYEEWEGTEEDLLSMIISLNLARRMLDTPAKIEIALKLVGTERGVNRFTVSQGNLTTKQASKLLGVSEHTITRAKAIARSGIPELQHAVKDLGFSIREASIIASLSPAEQARRVNEVALLRKLKESEVRTKHAEERKDFINQPFPPSQYDIIFMDCPWHYAKANGYYTSNPNHHFPCMTDDELAKLPVGDLAKPNSVLFMWSPSLKLSTSIRLMEDFYGFKFYSSAVWVKTIGHDTEKLSYVPGLGPFLNAHEYLLLGRRGKGLGKTHFQHRSVFKAIGGAGQIQHSAKPKIVYDTVEKMWPNTRKVELFAREQREGWTCWGNELNI